MAFFFEREDKEKSEEIKKKKRRNFVGKDNFKKENTIEEKHECADATGLRSVLG